MLYYLILYTVTKESVKWHKPVIFVHHVGAKYLTFVVSRTGEVPPGVQTTFIGSHARGELPPFVLWLVFFLRVNL